MIANEEDVCRDTGLLIFPTENETVEPAALALDEYPLLIVITEEVAKHISDESMPEIAAQELAAAAGEGIVTSVGKVTTIFPFCTIACGITNENVYVVRP